MQVCLRQRLIDAGLIGAERTSALEDQGNALERRPLHTPVGLAFRRLVSAHERGFRLLSERNVALSHVCYVSVSGVPSAARSFRNPTSLGLQHGYPANGPPSVAIMRPSGKLE